MQRAQDLVLRAILPWRPQTAARNLSIAAGVTREVDPIFMHDWAALRALARLHREAANLPVWMDELDLAYLAAPLLPRTPGAAEVLQRWGWQTTPGGIVRVAATGARREFCFARDNGEVLKAWLDFCMGQPDAADSTPPDPWNGAGARLAAVIPCGGDAGG